MNSWLHCDVSWRASILPVTDVPLVLPDVLIAPSSAEVNQPPSGIAGIMTLSGAWTSPTWGRSGAALAAPWTLTTSSARIGDSFISIR